MTTKNDHRGPRAEAGGKKVKDGKVFAVTIYPREVTKELIRKAAKKSKLSVSRFVLLSSLEKAVGKSKIRAMLPVDEYNSLMFNKYVAPTWSPLRRKLYGKKS